MSKNLTRKGLALASVSTLVVSGFAALPAQAAAGDVSIYPTSGLEYTVFNTDKFSFDSAISGLLPSNVEDGKLSYVISNPDQVGLAIDFGAGGADNDTVALTGYTSTGAAVTVAASLTIVDELASAGQLTDGGDKNGAFVVDFAHHNIVKLVISSMPSGLTDKDNTVTIRVTDTSAAGDGTIGLTNTQNGALTTLGYGDDDVSITLQAWLENDGLVSTVESDFASDVETVSFIDPETVSIIARVERTQATGLEFGSGDDALALATSMNSAGQKFLTGSLKFSRTVNLDQVNLAKWKYAVDSSVDADDVSTVAIDQRASGEAWAIATHNFEKLTAAGYTSADSFGRLLFRGAVTGDELAVGATYKVSFRHTADTTPFNDFASAAFEVVDNTAGATADNIVATVTTSTDAAQDNSADTGIDARSGAKALTYKTQIRTVADANLESANVPVAAVVTAGTYFPTGESITVSGTVDKIAKKSASVITTGLTDSKGNWSVTVTSTTAAAAQSYVVEFYVLDSDGIWQNVRNAANGAADYTTTYAAGTPTTFTADSSVLSGANVSVTYTVKDQFGQPISATSTGKALNVELKAPDKTKLEKFSAVSAGTATFTFANYLGAGLSDILTAKVYTGTSTSPTYVGSLSTTVSLYNTNAVAAVNVASKITGVVVTYDDFITGASSSTNVAPNDNSFTITGTVVDSNGAGVPGAPVTLSGKGFQFVKSGSTTYYVDSITLAVSEAGTFTVTGYTHVASATGNPITVKSGDKTATISVVSKVEDGDGALSAANLSFTWDLPAALVMNTTYAVTASVTDKWGNPIKGAEIEFAGYAAAQFNGAATATRTTAANGKATAYLRSLKDVDGVSAVGATLKKVNQNADVNEDVDNLGSALTNDTATVWDESKWSNVIESTVNFLKSSSAVAKVNVGSFNGKLVVYANGYNGKKISWKVGGRWGSAVASSNTARFDRPTPRTGVTLNVEVYVDGKLELTKSVVTR